MSSIQKFINSLPGQFRYSINDIIKEITLAKNLGIPAVALFPVTPEQVKTEDGEEAFNPNNLICRTIREIKNQVS